MAKPAKFRKAASLEIYMPVSELAELLDVTTSTVYLWMKEDAALLPPFTVFGPRTKLFKRSDVDAWIAKNSPGVPTRH